MPSTLRTVFLMITVALSIAPWAHADFDAPDIDDEPRGTNGLAYGRTHSEQHYPPLDQISGCNVERLGFAWSLELLDLRQDVRFRARDDLKRSETVATMRIQSPMIR